jgi:hypothetical protein
VAPLVDRGADERVAQLKPASSHLCEPCLLCCIERLPLRSKLRSCAQHGRELARVIRCSDKQKRLCLLWQPAHALEERALYAGAHRYRGQDRLRARELLRAQGRGELDQRERVARCLCDQPFAHLGRERRAGVVID